jgi:H+/Cl- antiporter ClcA
MINKSWLTKTEQYAIFLFIIKWLIVTLIVGFAIGSASAFFLYALDFVTNYREQNIWIIALLPIGGLLIGLSYYYWGQNVAKGNNQLIEEIHYPKRKIPFIMAPLVLFGTLVTHLFGGSAGREGTAVQVGGAIADQFTTLPFFNKRDRPYLIIIGISAGFASVFGTPLAGAIFALEVTLIGKIRFEALFPSLVAALFAHYACNAWGTYHTHYSIGLVPELSPINMVWVIIASLVFGLAALLFSKATHFWTAQFQKFVKYPPLRPFIGGIIVALAVYLIGTTKYIGLGIPTIVDSFSQVLPWYDSIVKLVFTSFTLGAGFKGGEVTPLFYIGATLGNALATVIPLPLGLLAGLGFVAVFSGATNTPIACTLMGIELFGIEAGVFIALACVTAYFFSGHTGIYSSQIIGEPKHRHSIRKKDKSLSDETKKGRN